MYTLCEEETLPEPVNWTNLRVRDRVVYAKQPIKQVICQIMFPEKVSLRGEDANVVGAFQDRIQDEYPLTRLAYNASIDFTVQASGLPLMQSAAAPRIPVRSFVDND